MRLQEDPCDKDCSDSAGVCDSFWGIKVDCSDSWALELCRATCKLCRPCGQVDPVVTNAASQDVISTGDTEDRLKQMSLELMKMKQSLKYIESHLIGRINGLQASTEPDFTGALIVKGSAELLFDNDPQTCATIGHGEGNGHNYWYWFKFPPVHVEYFSVFVWSYTKRSSQSSADFHITVYDKGTGRACGRMDGTQLGWQTGKCSSSQPERLAFIWINNFKSLQLCSVDLYGTPNN